MKIVFMGTPDFAVPCLETLINDKHQVMAVVTQPDRPKGRGQKMQAPQVKVVAEQNNIKVLQPEKVRNNQVFMDQLQELQPDLIVVVAYGKILPKEILVLPPLGCINVHASLLPFYRGSAPIHWSIINGETETGVTTMLMDEGMDTGNMLLHQRVPINSQDTVGLLHDKLSLVGAELLGKTVSFLSRGEIKSIPQDHDKATYAPMLNHEHEWVNWEKAANRIYNQIRGMNPWPGSYTKINGKVLKLWQAETVDKSTGKPCGTIVAMDNQGFVVQTGENCLKILELQLQGCKKMKAGDFLRGRKIDLGVVLGEEGGENC